MAMDFNPEKEFGILENMKKDLMAKFTTNVGSNYGDSAKAGAAAAAAYAQALEMQIALLRMPKKMMGPAIQPAKPGQPL